MYYDTYRLPYVLYAHKPVHEEFNFIPRVFIYNNFVTLTNFFQFNGISTAYTLRHKLCVATDSNKVYYMLEILIYFIID